MRTQSRSALGRTAQAAGAAMVGSFCLLGFTLSCDARRASITAEADPRSLPGQAPVRVLTATVDASPPPRGPRFYIDAASTALFLRGRGEGGADLRVIDIPSHQPSAVLGPGTPGETAAHVAVVAERDFAGDSHTEALVELQPGGNACGPSYLLALDAPWVQERTTRWTTDVFAPCTYGDPTVSEGRKPSISVSAAGGETSFSYQGVVMDPATKTRRPAFRVALAQRRAVAAVLAPLPNGKGPAEIVTAGLDERKRIEFDLNEDGQFDVIECAPGRNAVCTVTLAGGAQAGTFVVPSRIGVLPSKTQKMHDLVIGDRELHWNGSDYE